MESYLINLEVQPKHSSSEALEKWRKLSGVVKNPKRRFLSKHWEAAAMRSANQEKFRIAVLGYKAAFQFMQGMQPSDYTVPEEVKAAGFQICAGELGSIVEGHDVKELKFHGGVVGIASHSERTYNQVPTVPESEGRSFLEKLTIAVKVSKTAFQFIQEKLSTSTTSGLTMNLGVCAFVSLILGIAMEGWPIGTHDGLGIVTSILLVVFVTATSDYRQSLQFEIMKILLSLVLICLNLVRVIALELQLTILALRMDHVLNCIEKLFGAESVYTEQNGVKNQVKMLTAVLKFMVDATAMGLFLAPPSDAFDVANNLVDLIISIELYLGTGYAACLVAAMKPWLPYLILALVSLSLQGAIGGFTLSVTLLSSKS